MRNSRTGTEGRKEVESDTSFVVRGTICQEGIFVAGSHRKTVLTCGNSSCRPRQSDRAFRCKPAPGQCDVPCSWRREDALRRVYPHRAVLAPPQSCVPDSPQWVREMFETIAGFPRSQSSQA